MATGVEELLDMLFNMVDDAKSVPLSGDKCMLERDKTLDLIDDIRAQFPVELGEAKKMMANRAEVIAASRPRPRPSVLGPRSPSCCRPSSSPPS